MRVRIFSEASGEVSAADTDGNIEIYFQHYKEPFNTEEAQDEFRKKLMLIKGLHINKNRLFKRPSFKCSLLAEESERKLFISLFEEFLAEVKKTEE